MKVYVEKYDSMEGLLLLDFIFRQDYLNFCEIIDHPISKNDPRTMLFIYGLRFEGGNIPKEGKVYSMPEQLLKEVQWQKEPGYLGNDEANMTGYSNIISFRTSVDYKGLSYFDIPNSFEFQLISRKKIYFLSTRGNHHNKKWPWAPCGAERLRDDVKVIARNVGQGNWNEIYSNDECQIIYDIGGSIHAKNYEIKSWINSSNAFQANPTLLISHWDVDHYLSIFEVEEDSLERVCCAYVPDKLTTATSQRAFERLYRYCPSVVVVPESQNRKVKRKISLDLIAKGSNYAFFVGEKSSDINKSGLTLAVWNDTSCALLCGDHSYSQIFLDMCSHIPSNRCINIITPHHGGDAGKIFNPGTTNQFGIAVTSTGKNSYGHPRTQTRDDLLRLGFKWLRTDFENDDIVVSL